MSRLIVFTRVIVMISLVGSGLCHAEEKSGTKMAGTAAHWNFDAVTKTTLPAGARVFSGLWALRAEAGAPSSPNALCQNGSADYPAIVLGDGVYSDATVTTSFKPVSGTEDQAAGIIFRVQDKDNY